MAASTNETEAAAFTLLPADFATLARDRVQEFANAQTILLEAFQETNQHWRDRIAAMAKIEVDFACKLAGARSIPDAVSASQEWASRHLELAAQDTGRLLNGAQRFMQTGAEFLGDGWAKSFGASS